MKTNTKLAVALLVSGLFAPVAAFADVPGDHPAYLHALTDLRDARWNVEHRQGDIKVAAHEAKAIAEIDLAIVEVKKAARDDGKNTENHPQEDANMDRPGRLHRAAELLRKAHSDIAQEEDNPNSRGLKHRALEHIDAATKSVDRAIRDVEHHS